MSNLQYVETELVSQNDAPAASINAREAAAWKQLFEMAKMYPRDIPECVDKAVTLATMDQETAEDCFYVLPRRGPDGKNITGPSVRLAEILMNAWGRILVETGAAEGERFITCHAEGLDLERMVRVRQEVRVRITKRNGDRYGDDMIQVASMAGQSKALRNVVLRLVPPPLVNRVLREARQVAIGDAQTLTDRVAAAFDYAVKLGVTKEHVLARLERSHQSEVTAEDLLTLRSLYKQIRDEGLSVDRVFPAPKDESDDQVPTPLSEPDVPTAPAETTGAETLPGESSPLEDSAAPVGGSGSDPVKPPRKGSKDWFRAEIVEYIDANGVTIEDLHGGYPIEISELADLGISDLKAIYAGTQQTEPKSEEGSMF